MVSNNVSLMHPTFLKEQPTKFFCAGSSGKPLPAKYCKYTVIFSSLDPVFANLLQTPHPVVTDPCLAEMALQSRILGYVERTSLIKSLVLYEVFENTVTGSLMDYVISAAG